MEQTATIVVSVLTIFSLTYSKPAFSEEDRPTAAYGARDIANAGARYSRGQADKAFDEKEKEEAKPEGERDQAKINYLNGQIEAWNAQTAAFTRAATQAQAAAWAARGNAPALSQAAGAAAGVHGYLTSIYGGR